MTKRILIITDEEPNELLRQALAARGFDVTIEAEPKDGYQQLIQSQFDLAVINLNRAITGIDLIKKIRSNSRLSRLFVLTIAEWGTGQPTIALAQGADSFEPKPVDAAQIVSTIERMLQQNLARTAAVGNGEAID